MAQAQPVVRKMPFRPFLAGFLLALFQPAGLFAQPKEEEPKQKFTFKAIAFARVPGLEEIYFGEERETLRLPSRNFSQPLEYEGTYPTIFYGKKKDEEGNEIYYPVATVEVPEGLKEVILVFLSTSRKVALTGRRFQILQLDADKARFPGGGRHFVNLTTTDVGVTIGEQKILARAQSSVTFVPDAKTAEAGRVPVQVHFRREGTWRLLSSTRWTMDSRVNTLVFIFEDPIRKRISLRGITNRLSAPPPLPEESEEE